MVRGDLDWIVMKALEKDRRRRYESANGLAEDVQRYLNNEPVQARPPSPFYRFQKLVRRNQITFAAIAAVTVALVLGLGTSTWLFIREREARMEQLRLRQAAENRQKLTQAMVLLTHNQFEQADQLIHGVPATEVGLEYAYIYRTLSGWHAVHRRWQQAVERFAVVLQLNEADDVENTMDYLRYGPILVGAGDLAGYERFRRAAIARHGSTTHPVVAERVVKISLLTPPDREMVRALQPLAEIATQSLAISGPDVDVGLTAWRAFSMALMKFRDEDDAGAVALCERSLGYYFSNAALSASDKLVLAMAHFRLGQTDLAHAELAQSRREIENNRASNPDVNWYWFDWLFAEVLLGEATAMIGK